MQRTTRTNRRTSCSGSFSGKLILLLKASLARYISGVNKEGEEVEMTIPVLSTLTFKEDNMMNNKMCFYLNKKHQANPPTPIDPTVKVEAKEMTVFVHSFDGLAMKDSVWIDQARVFGEVLASAGVEVDTSTFLKASYASFFTGHEVMYLAQTNQHEV